MNYLKQLLSEEWKIKRLQILKRDKFCCTKCGSKTNLQVHHELYERGKMAWEINEKFLKTLCKICHFKIHEERHISTFFNQKKKSKQKKLSKREILYSNLSEEDLRIQKLYDKINLNKKLYERFKKK